MNGVLQLGSGKMSTFGGPSDMDVRPDEGLALIGASDLALWWFGHLFLAEQPKDTTGLARRLNPRAFYCAMRWNEILQPFGYSYSESATTQMLRHAIVRVSLPKTRGLVALLRPVDYGPGDGKLVDGKPTQDTGRLIDLSPGGAASLGLQTDMTVCCELILPEVAL